MLVLASIPSVSVLAVAARAAAFGFSHGLFATLGIIAADIIFILIAVYGLVVIAEVMGEHFAWIKYLGAVYLIWLGVSLWRTDFRSRHAETPPQSSRKSSFMTGLLITLGDQKAILFYLGFFPAFFDLSSLRPADTLILILLACVAIGGPKLVYAWLADRASLVFKNSGAVRGLNLLAASVMITVGVVLFLKTREWI